MPWANAFDLGSCSIEVYNIQGSPVLDYSGTLGKGQSAAVPDGVYTGLSVSVSALGVISLANGDAVPVENNFEIRVIPAYLIAGRTVRVTLPTSATGTGSASANGVDFIDFANGDAFVDLSAQTADRITAKTYAAIGLTTSPIIQFTPEISQPPVAGDKAVVTEKGSYGNVVTISVTSSGSPVTPDSVAVVTQPAHGAASVSGITFLYTPSPGYEGLDSFTYTADVDGATSSVGTVSIKVVPTHNCDCSDTTANKTLKQLRDDMMTRLGFAAQVNNPPPGMAALLNSFLIEAQELLYRRYDVLRTERFYSWFLQEGVRMYDFADNDESCTKRLDPRKVTWAGYERDGLWHPLVCGIPPQLYSTNGNGWPQRYEIRQCIEVWPAPGATEGSLVIKGHFGLEAFAADTDKTTIDDRLVFLLALSNAKAHYGRPDAGNYVQELETLMGNLVAGSHHTRRYLPGRDGHTDYVYSMPRPTEPFA